MDIYTIIFLALAVFIFLRLRSVLGQRTGSERPPYDRAAPNVVQRTQDNNNVVPMPGARDRPGAAGADARMSRRRPTAGRALPSRARRWPRASTPLPPQDSSFDPRHFISGARGAYEMIVLAFANGDRRALKDLLSQRGL